jgi:parallel beta-helix repeat protein
MNNQFSNGGITLSESTYNSITGNTISKAKMGLKLVKGAACDSITKNKFQYCNVGVQVQSVPKSLTGNTYYKNKVNIKIVK